MGARSQAKFARPALILLDRASKRASAFAELCPQIVTNASDVRKSVETASKDSLWVSYSSDLTDALVKRATAGPASLGVGLFIHSLDLKLIPLLLSLFSRIAFAVDGKFLPAEELAEVLHATNRDNLFIGGFVNSENESITFWRGNMESLTIPFSAFGKPSGAARPDFDCLSIIDAGQTVKLGGYEAAVDAILYEFDAEYRREIAKRRRQEDRSFGAALRRLRLQRGLRREDFEPDISEKTVARIEQGKVTRIHKSTLLSLAKHLAVEPEEIGSF